MNLSLKPVTTAERLQRASRCSLLAITPGLSMAKLEIFPLSKNKLMSLIQAYFYINENISQAVQLLKLGKILEFIVNYYKVENS